MFLCMFLFLALEKDFKLLAGTTGSLARGWNKELLSIEPHLSMFSLSLFSLYCFAYLCVVYLNCLNIYFLYIFFLVFLFCVFFLSLIFIFLVSQVAKDRPNHNHKTCSCNPKTVGIASGHFPPLYSLTTTCGIK